MSMRSDVIYKLWNAYTKWIPIVQKVILNVFISESKYVQKTNGLIFPTNCSSIKQQCMKLGDGFPKKRGGR